MSLTLCFSVARRFQSLLILITCILLVASCTSPEPARVLIFSRTKGFRHSSIKPGIPAIAKLCLQHHVQADSTEDPANINEENLKRYRAVIFLNTTGDILNQEQQNDFERFIQAGGGFVGIHSATDTEYDWAWYGKLVGAYFNGHPGNPNVQKGTYHIAEKHPATDSLPDPWERADEFYNFKSINPDLKVLLRIDESTYQGGTNGKDHPMAWYHDFDGGRAFYTNLGHTDESFADPLYLKHLWGGIEYALGGEKGKPLNYAVVHTERVPAENRFTIHVLDEKLDEPMELTVLPGNRVLFIERKGAVKIYDPQAKKTKTIATIPVSTKYHSDDGTESEAEDGLLGLAKDPDYAKNNWIYLYYSAAGNEPKNILTRYELKGDELVESSRKVILEVATQRKECCHTGGSIVFDPHGNLFLSTGDNTSPRDTGYSPSDERKGRYPWDAQKSSANTNDLRGKILRIHPEADGTYTIPEGNLFPKGMAKTRPEIYAMGERNPFRISIDNKTGFVYWGEVGPDAGKDSTGFGPKGYDEVNQARKPGFFGWPYFVGNNRAYTKRDFATKKSGAPFDPAKPMNHSPNNTGLNELPPSQAAFIYYPYEESKEFPLVGTGGRTAMAGPVFYSDEFAKAERPFPAYYNGKLFIYEWMRGWIMAVTMDKDGNYVSMERFMPGHKFSNPMDMEFAPDGDLYVLEYGTRWFQGNDDARLLRIEYNGGNRTPSVVASADKTSGATPLTVNFSSEGTTDPDRDKITYRWKFFQPDSSVWKTVADPGTSLTFDKPGVYTAVLTATDEKGASSISSIRIQAGNEPPKLALNITRGNKSFFFKDQSFDYDVTVSDLEDGSLESGTIRPDQVSVTIKYVKDAEAATLGHQFAEGAGGQKLMEESDCKACHSIDKKSIGPTYQQIAAKYNGDAKAADQLANKVISGGGGVWGEAAMAAHPQLSVADAKQIVTYILSLADKDEAAASLPVKGTYAVKIPKGVSDKGVFVLQASYTDKGANGLPPVRSQQTLVLRNPGLSGGDGIASEGVQKFSVPNPPMDLAIGMKNGASLGFEDIDFTAIDQVLFVVSAPVDQLHAAGGTIELHLDSPGGQLIGTSRPIVPTQGKIMTQLPQMVPVAIAPTQGTHSLYAVFRNDKSPSGQALFIITHVQFISSGRPGPHS